MAFSAIRDPASEEVARLEDIEPDNPFLTASYVEARRVMGARVVLFAERCNGVITGGTLGYLQGRTLLPWLEITTSPVGLADETSFWEGVLEFCRRARVVSVEAGSFGSRKALLPEWSTPVEPRSRTEWRLNLGRSDAPSLSANHRRSINKARKAGVVVVRSSTPEAARTHSKLMAASMSRRAERGESVPVVSEREEGMALAFLNTGAGRVYQAVHQDEVVSSLLVLMASSGAYYQSAGTTPHGMDIGASTLLVTEIISQLREEELQTFNLSGAGTESPGLRRFKSAFGANPVELQAAVYQTAPFLVRKALTALRLLAHDRGRLGRWLVRLERSEVYAADPASLARAADGGARLIALSSEQLAEVATLEPQYQDQSERARKLGYCAAFGLEVDGAIRHVCWLIDHQADLQNRYRKVGLRRGEAEITHCFTPEQYRGQGVYPRAIRAVAAIAADNGIRRVYMIASSSNTSSLHGIRKAGLQREGSVYHFWLADRVSVILRGHRWWARTRGGAQAGP
jgi:RimJ/RimL family protein N-acetyltransferase